MADELGRAATSCFEEFISEEGESGNRKLFKYAIEQLYLDNSVLGFGAGEDDGKVVEMTNATEAMSINENGQKIVEMTSETEAMQIDDKERGNDFDPEDVDKMLNEKPSQHPLDRLRAMMLTATFDVMCNFNTDFDRTHLAMLCKQIPQFASDLAFEGLRSGRLEAKHR